VKRPTGVTVLAIALLVSAVFRFMISFIDFGIGGWLTAMAMSPGYVAPEAVPAVAALGNLGFWIGLIGMMVAAITLIAVRGLWTLSTWGWWLTVALLLIGLTLSLIPMSRGVFTTRIVMLAILDAAFLAYLFTPQIRAFFSGAPGDVSAPA
jgi:hypothetical protein